jgi:hypothetical protein
MAPLPYRGLGWVAEFVYPCRGCASVDPLFLLKASRMAWLIVVRWRVPYRGTGGSSSSMHAFSNILVHLPLVPAWLCLRCWRKWSAR